eukprot:SAG22_NODE_15_length_32914_cov_20.713546_18_plen_836_part_00
MLTRQAPAPAAALLLLAPGLFASCGGGAAGDVSSGPELASLASLGQMIDDLDVAGEPSRSGPAAAAATSPTSPAPPGLRLILSTMHRHLMDLTQQQAQGQRPPPADNFDSNAKAKLSLANTTVTTHMDLTQQQMQGQHPPPAENINSNANPNLKANTTHKPKVGRLNSSSPSSQDDNDNDSLRCAAKCERAEGKVDALAGRVDAFDRFVHGIESRRRLQEDAQCRGDGLTEMLAACCPASGGGGGHRRELQGSGRGCAAFPDTCSAACAPLFTEYYSDCHGMIEGMPAAEQAEFDSFYTECEDTAQAAAVMLAGASPALMFHVVVIDQEAEQQAAMASGGSAPSGPPFGPVVLPPIGPPPPSSSAGGSGTGAASEVQEYRRVCSKANLTTCAPPCNHISDGFLLNILIQSRGTVMTCSQEEGVFSWQGQSALGSCITARAETWLENILTHAAGTFALDLAESVTVATAADLVAGQSAVLRGSGADDSGADRVWSFVGEGPAFVVGAGGELEIQRLTVTAASGLGFRVAGGSSAVVLAGLRLQRGDGSATDISCQTLATGVGEDGLTCADTGVGGVNVGGPLFISTSGAGFGMGATKYMGSDRSLFEEAVSTREPGLYTCQISHDEVVALTLPVESAMHVSIIGDDSMPQYTFDGEGAAFTVAVHAYLTLGYLTVPGGAETSMLRGGELSLDHTHLSDHAHLGVAGSLSISSSQLDDVEFVTAPDATITMEAASIVGTGAGRCGVRHCTGRDHHDGGRVHCWDGRRAAGAESGLHRLHQRQRDPERRTAFDGGRGAEPRRVNVARRRDGGVCRRGRQPDRLGLAAGPWRDDRSVPV